MAPDLHTLPSQHEVVSESVESLQAQIKKIEDKWNDELKRLDTARRDKEELEQTLRVLQTLVEYEREATLKMEAILREARDILGVSDDASRPPPETGYDPSGSKGSSSSGDSSALEFDLVYNPNAVLPIPLETPSAPSPPLLPDTDNQATSVPALLGTPVKPASKPKRSPNWKSRITSILINTNNHNRTNPAPSSPHSLGSASPSFDDASFHAAKSKPAAKSRKRPSQDTRGPGGWRRTMGSAGKFANRENRDINRRKAKDLASIPQN